MLLKSFLPYYMKVKCEILLPDFSVQHDDRIDTRVSVIFCIDIVTI